MLCPRKDCNHLLPQAFLTPVISFGVKAIPVHSILGQLYGGLGRGNSVVWDDCVHPGIGIYAVRWGLLGKMILLEDDSDCHGDASAIDLGHFSGLSGPFLRLKSIRTVSNEH